MTTELWTLVAAGSFCLVLPFLYMALYANQVGMQVISGNRDNAPVPAGAAGRGQRAHRNLMENLLPFAIAILAAHAAGVSNTMTVAGAEVFLAARVVHAISYFAGVTGIRTLAYIASLVGTALILSQLF